MSNRLAVMVMLLALAAIAVPLHASPAAPVEPSGIKSAGEFDSDTAEAPATTTIGMLVTVLLVMGASTMTLLGGGIKNAVNTIRGTTPPPLTAPATPAPARPAPVAEAEAQAKPQTAKQEKKSPKNKSRRTVAQQRAFEQRRQQMRMAQRGATKAPLRKRGGPGCRGVR